ncbi:MAG: hypothetical protein ACSW8I_03845 [bacterium]
MLKSIENVIKSFEERDIKYCHWKSNEHLKEALDGDTDLDVLFDPAQRVQLEMVLDKCGMKRFRSTPLMQYNGIEDFIGYDFETAKIWHLHTHYRMTLGEKHLKGYTMTPWGKKILENSRRDEYGIFCSSYEDELFLLLVRMALKIRLRDRNKKIGKDDIKELEWLRLHVDTAKFEHRIIQFVGGKTATELARLSSDKTLAKKRQLLKLRRLLLKELKLFTGYTRLTSRYMRTRRELHWLIGGIKRRMGINSHTANRRVSPNGGNVIAFLGCDGAGKSTTLDYIKKELNKKLDICTIYFGSGDGSSSILRKPMKLVAKKVGGKGLGHAVEKEYSEKKKVSLKSRLYSFAKVIWAVTLAYEKKSKIRLLTKARNNGLIVLTDRYPQTLRSGCNDGPLLSTYYGKRLLGKLAAWERKVYENAIINPPDLTVKLIVPTEVAIKRKPEMTVEEIESKKSIVMEMNLSDNTVIVDTSRPFENTRAEILDEIWKIL